MTSPRLVNLTPHRLHVIDEAGATLLDAPASPVPARLVQETVEQHPIGPTAVPVRTIAYGSPVNLPEPEDGTLFVVSRVVAQELGRPDLLFPDDEVRDDHGRIVACHTLACFSDDRGLLRSGGGRVE